jgi:hypothetical protein
MMMMKNKRLINIMLGVALILLIPFIAMQFTNEVDWNLFDFLVAGTLLTGAGIMGELVMRTIGNKDYQIGMLAVILIALCLIWAELAVGVFGTPFAGS